MSGNRGQTTLHKLGTYFDKDNVKPPIDDPEKITLQEAQDNIKAVKRYFTEGAYENEIFLALIFPAVLILLFILVIRRDKSEVNIHANIPDKDFDFIEMVRLQKGLEEFDRDLLIELASENSIKPLYQVLIDKELFEKVENELIEQIAAKGESPDQNRRIRYLRKVKSKLFN